MPHPTIKDALRELYNWRRHAVKEDPATNFTAMLFLMMQRADPSNLAALARGFPHEYEVFRAWLTSPSERAFFESHGFNWPLGD